MFYLKVDSTCAYWPSTFEKVFKYNKAFVRALPEGTAKEKLPDEFYVRVGDDFELDDVCTDKLEMAVKYLIIDALLRHNWQQQAAAKYLGISSRRMNYYVQKFGIRHHGWGKYHGGLSADSGDESELSWDD